MVTRTRPRSAAVVLLAGAALALMNATVANVAVPAIQVDLGLSAAGVSWTLAGWALTYALALVPAGWLGDRFGQRRVFVGGLLLFVVASALAAVVQSEWQLIAARLLQGAAGGTFYPAIAASLSMLFRGASRSRVFGALGATIGAGAGIGPILGGLLLQIFGPDLGWRAVFAINIPLGLLIVVAALAVVPRPSGHDGGRFDIVGFALLTVGLGAALGPLIVGENVGWPWWIWLVLTAGVLLLVAFVQWERRIEGRGGAPIVAPSMFRNRDYAVSVGLGLSQFAGFISIFTVLALLWQSGLGRSGLEMGLLTLPEALASMIGAAMVAPLISRLGSRGTVILGSAALTGGLLAVAAVPAFVPTDVLTVPWLIGPLALTGFGGGIAISATLNHALGVVPQERSGAASGVIATVQRVGNALGLAVVGGVFFAVLGTSTAPESYAWAASVGLGLCAAIAAVGLVLACFLRRSAVGVRT